MGEGIRTVYLHLLNESPVFVKDPVRALANVYQILTNESAYVKNVLNVEDPGEVSRFVANKQNSLEGIVSRTQKNFSTAPNMGIYVLTYALLRASGEEMGWSRERLAEEIKSELVEEVWSEIEEIASPGKSMLRLENPFRNRQVLQGTYYLSRN